ncbi:5-formyltetrahydrofolate cyclo-ligase [Stieleria sp. JC731]|uniref:5-formyltetrahydrofolate cyclo-ligase n=1 Tax=Pirellulaceae TaxID=2691357 RepID=UPI001E46B6C7|nr:5-formyltetrahydrofolate cyclo-ligase [Stieleria sp. JC731]MCC9603454.1 5-formyltetrahydrofolate cyclo-ligase [Stieleria sp. JC731]
MADQAKNVIRDQARKRRRERFAEAPAERDRVSDIICSQVDQLAGYTESKCVLWYVGVRDEVATQRRIATELERGATSRRGSSPTTDRRILVPFCEGNDLVLFDLHSIEELERGAFGILEPAANLKAEPERLVSPEAVDFAIIPGLAFDTSGHRMGYGRGFYDRTLQRLVPNTPRVALAFDCQMFDRVPTEAHDVTMDWVITESGIIQCGLT